MWVCEDGIMDGGGVGGGFLFFVKLKLVFVLCMCGVVNGIFGFVCCNGWGFFGRWVWLIFVNFKGLVCVCMMIVFGIYEIWYVGNYLINVLIYVVGRKELCLLRCVKMVKKKRK